MAAAFVMLSANVWRANHPVALDRLATRLGLTAGELGKHPPIAERVEHLGSREGVGLTALALAGLAVIWRDWVTALVALLAPVVCFGVTEYVAKPLINEPIAFGGQRAFPSGHAAGVTAVAVTAVILFHRRWGGVAAILSAALGLAAVLAVGLAVLSLRLHQYPTEVIGGAALGAAVVLTLAAVLSLGWRSVAAWLPGRASRTGLTPVEDPNRT